MGSEGDARAATGGRTVLGEEGRAVSFFGCDVDDDDGGLSAWEFLEWSDAGLAESLWEVEVCRMLDGREKDCSNGLGSRSKSERICRVGGCLGSWVAVWWCSGEAEGFGTESL